MPRKPRFNLIGVPQHVIQRGNNREPCFFAEEDYRCYLDALADCTSKFGCQVHAYVLMTNHVHLLMTPLTDYGISQVMQALGRRYVRYVNGTYRRTGTLWEGRFKASLIESERYLLTCMRYIELNPVRAAMVEHPGEYRWSSYKCNGQGSNDDAIEPHALYQALGSDETKRQGAYRELFRAVLGSDTVHEIRASLNHESVLGSSHFREKIEAMTQRVADIRPAGRPKVNEDVGAYEY